MQIRSTLKLPLVTLAILAVGAAAFAAVVFGGIVDVAATTPHFAPVEWTLRTTLRNSVRRHARNIEVPAGVNLRDPAVAERGFGHYSEVCSTCHGGPGVDPAPWIVLLPHPRPLVETAASWTDAELYWIVKHGIRMTGMPAVGATHEDAELWEIAAFVRQLPEMSPEDYESMAARHRDHGMHEGHH